MVSERDGRGQESPLDPTIARNLRERLGLRSRLMAIAVRRRSAALLVAGPLPDGAIAAGQVVLDLSSAERAVGRSCWYDAA